MCAVCRCLDPPAHLSYFDDRNIVRLLEAAGFEQVRVRRFGFKWVELAMRYRVTAALLAERPATARCHSASACVMDVMTM